MRLLRLLSLLMVLCLLLSACTMISPAAGEPTPMPQVQPPTVALAQTSAPAASPTAVEAVTEPTPVPIKGTVTFGFDAFATYYPALIMQTRGLLAKRGYELKLVPFELDEQYSFSADEQWAKLKSGEFDVMATTLNSFSIRGDPAFGAITAVVDESAGADKIVGLPEIVSINDLKGKRIAFNQGSVSEYFLYYALSLAGMTPQDVTLVPKGSTDEAVKAYTDGEADALSAWEPNVLDAEAAGAHEIITSTKLRAIIDVLVSSRVAIQKKSDALQAFHDAWFEALRLMIDSPDEGEQAIIDWGHTDWSYIEKPGDLKASLEHLAQATLAVNKLVFLSPELIVSRLNLSQEVWRQAGRSLPSSDLDELVYGRFVFGSARLSQLATLKSPVNSSFILTGRVELPQLSEAELQNTQLVVKLPLEQIGFEPDSVRLTQQATKDLLDQILPVLRSTNLYLRIEGSSAWPGPQGRFSQEQIEQFARERAQSVAQFLGGQGIDPNRLIISTVPSKFPNSFEEAELTQDRVVLFKLITLSGR